MFFNTSTQTPPYMRLQNFLEFSSESTLESNSDELASQDAINHGKARLLANPKQRLLENPIERSLALDTIQRRNSIERLFNRSFSEMEKNRNDDRYFSQDKSVSTCD